MKNTAMTINKLIAYARGNLMLDALDETYALNKLSELSGVENPVCDNDFSEYEDLSSPDSLIAELKTECKDIDADEVMDAIFPMPHMVNYYFNDEFTRNKQKAFDFVFDLYAAAGFIGTEGGSGKYTRFCSGKQHNRPIALNVGGADKKYYPVSKSGNVATLSCDDDFITEDIVMREYAYAKDFGGVIAKRGDQDYFTANSAPITKAAVKKQLKSGVVNIDLLDYPVPAVAFYGIAKNTVCRKAADAINSSDVKPVIACAATDDGIKIYAIFANEIKDELVPQSTALDATGIFQTIDLSPVLPVLEKGVALSTDLFAYKPIYNKVGGTKYGSKAAAALEEGAALIFDSILAASASATPDKAEKLAEETEPALAPADDLL